MSATYSDGNAQPLKLADLTRTILDFQVKHGKLMKAVKVSSETLRWIEQIFPTYPAVGGANTLYGVPIQIDNDLALFDCKPVYD